MSTAVQTGQHSKQSANSAPPQPKHQPPLRSREQVTPAQLPSSSSTGQPQVPVPPAPAVTAAATAVQPPQDVAQPKPIAATGSVRLGRTEVPKNIPNMGGRRPKQSQAVRHCLDLWCALCLCSWPYFESADEA
jgi:hypothetical protein